MYPGPVLRADATQDVQLSPLDINLQQINAIQIMLCHQRRHCGHCAALRIRLEQVVPYIPPAQGTRSRLIRDIYILYLFQKRYRYSGSLNILSANLRRSDLRTLPSARDEQGVLVPLQLFETAARRKIGLVSMSLRRPAM